MSRIRSARRRTTGIGAATGGATYGQQARLGANPDIQSDYSYGYFLANRFDGGGRGFSGTPGNYTYVTLTAEGWPASGSLAHGMSNLGSLPPGNYAARWIGPEAGYTVTGSATRGSVSFDGTYRSATVTSTGDFSVTIEAGTTDARLMMPGQAIGDVTYNLAIAWYAARTRFIRWMKGGSAPEACPIDSGDITLSWSGGLADCRLTPVWGAQGPTSDAGASYFYPWVVSQSNGTAVLRLLGGSDSPTLYFAYPPGHAQEWQPVAEADAPTSVTVVSAPGQLTTIVACPIESKNAHSYRWHLVRDSVEYAHLRTPAVRQANTSYSQEKQGLAISQQVAASNALHAANADHRGAWFCLTANATQACRIAWMTYIRDNLVAGIDDVLLTLGNEVIWNVVYGQGSWLRRKAIDEVAAGGSNLAYDGLNLSTDWTRNTFAQRLFARKLRDLYLDAVTVFGGANVGVGKRVKVVMEWQNGASTSILDMLDYLNAVYGSGAAAQCIHVGALSVYVFPTQTPGGDWVDQWVATPVLQAALEADLPARVALFTQAKNAFNSRGITDVGLYEAGIDITAMRWTNFSDVGPGGVTAAQRRDSHIALLRSSWGNTFEKKILTDLFAAGANRIAAFAVSPGIPYDQLPSYEWGARASFFRQEGRYGEQAESPRTQALIDVLAMTA